jgi:hypothetical protein
MEQTEEGGFELNRPTWSRAKTNGVKHSSKAPNPNQHANSQALLQQTTVVTEKRWVGLQ